MKFTLNQSGYLYNRRVRSRLNPLLWVLVGATLVAGYWYWHLPPQQRQTQLPGAVATPAPATPGSLLSVVSTQTLTLAETAALAKRNYGAATLPVTTGITKITFRYRSELPDGTMIVEYARAYLPANPRTNLSIFAFAPGTTGIGDECAASLEEPGKANWGDYDSHMAMYASQGYAAVTTDYEGMRDATRIHHYMVGELEGRAVLDSVRALENLAAARGRLNPANVFLAGYSQGGHAAFWADKIAAAYAPEIKPKGVVGFGPVMDVQETLTDVTHAANINWFGPYVLFSYGDYYHDNYGPVLLPRWADSLATDVPAHCIDSDLTFWGHIPANVYTPDFLQAVNTGQLGSAYPALVHDLAINAVGADSTSSAKRINSGQQDNVVLPAQQQAAAALLCGSSSGPVQLNIYPNTTHYDTMVHSLSDTLAWMHTLSSGGMVASTCQ